MTARMSTTSGQLDLLVVAIVLALLPVTPRGIARVTGSSRGCPGCHGRLVPPLRVGSILELPRNPTIQETKCHT
jgi:hypothetical protein